MEASTSQARSCSGPRRQHSGTYQVRLRVTDNFGVGTQADTIITVVVSIPPLAPTAAPGGPYNLCPASKPWFLDGSASVNPDEGQHGSGAPGDTIYGAPSQFSWNLGVGFGDAIGVKPDVTTFFSAKSVGSYLVFLRVTDTTATSFPTVLPPTNLSSTSQAYVNVLDAGDPLCVGCTVLSAKAAGRQVQMTWTNTGAAGYAVYRGTHQRRPLHSRSRRCRARS